MTAAAPEAGIRLEGLHKRYAGEVALDGLDLTVGRGEIVCLLGVNGAGKTTALEIAEGLRAADAGTVRVLGMDPVADRRRVARHMGLMLQRAELPMPSRPIDALELFAAFYEDPLDPRGLLDHVGIAALARRPYRTLSGGERQRLQLCLALVGRPDVAILDEPTAAMDVAARRQCWELLRELRSRGAAILVATHLLDEAEAVADRVAVLHRGRLVALGTPAELRRSGDDGDAQGAVGREISLDLGTVLDIGALERLGRLPGLVSLRSDRPGRYLARGPDLGVLLVELTTWLWAAGIEPRSIEVAQVSLEDVFLRLVQEAAQP